MGFGRTEGRGGSVNPPWQGPYLKNTLISSILFLQTMPPSLWATAKDGMEVMKGNAVGLQNVA